MLSIISEDPMSLVRREECRRTETPNAIMTTLASPTQGEASSALWRVEMEPGASGPAHLFEAEQVWTVLDGAADIELGGERLALVAGDTLVMPAGVPRRVHADAERGFAAVVAAPPGARAMLPDGTDRGVPAWAA
jgi:quercetin dioxygenase-like cupin family protein